MQPTITLNNGHPMPQLAFGTFRIKPGEETIKSVITALQTGYRHIDTAQYYNNESGVGEAVNKSGVPREEIFVTSKVEIANFGHKQAKESVYKSLEKAKLEYFDAFILHFPVMKLRIESYKALEELQKEGVVRSIGVSNFTIKHLEELIEQTETLPTINQVEFSPYLYQKELLEYCQDKNIQLQAYSPLTQGRKLDDPKLLEIANKYNKSTAQIMVRWCLQHDIVTLVKSTKPERIKQNFEVFDFEISQEDMEILNGFDEGLRCAWNPEDEKQVKTFSSGVMRKLSLLGKLSKYF